MSQQIIKLIEVDDVSHILGLARFTVQTFLKTGQLKHHGNRIGRAKKYFIAVEDLWDFIQSHPSLPKHYTREEYDAIISKIFAE